MLSRIETAQRILRVRVDIQLSCWRLHDLRTTFNTHSCERLKVDAAVADRILNHVATATTSKIMRVYNKSELFEERKVALQAWERLLSDDVLPATERAMHTG